MAEITVTIARAGGGDPVERRVGKRSFVIGSDARADVVVDGDAAIAGEHVRVIVRRADGAIIVRRIGGATRVNGIEIDIPVTVAPTDRVSIGAATVLAFAPVEVGPASGRRWWDPRDWREARIGPVPIPMPLTNPPMIAAPPDEPAPAPPPEPVPTWNPPPPNPADDTTRIIQLRGNPPRPAVDQLLPLPAPRWHDVLADDPTEHDLLAALRAAPGDASARMVYADWCERAGRDACASAVRGIVRPEILAVTTPTWRAIATCAAIQACNVADCSRRWSALVAVEGDENSRTCTTCNARVYYGDTQSTIIALGTNGAKYVPDAEHEGRAHLAYYHRGKSRRR